MAESIFKDTYLQKRFDEDGYVVFDFISALQTQQIADKFYEIHLQIPEGFYADAYNSDDKLKEEIFRHTDKIIQPTLESFFENYKKLGATFLCKAPGENGKVGVHQDWTIVDEAKYFSATIWIPLQDVDENNGALRVIPGSHLFFDAVRSNNIPYSYRGNESFLWENMITVPMKLGQAFVLNHAVIHGSSPNLTNKERLVIAYGLTHKDASLVFYHKEKNEQSDTIEKYEMPDDFFQRYYNVGQRPEFGKLVEKMCYAARVYSLKELKQFIHREYTKRRLSVSYSLTFREKVMEFLRAKNNTIISACSVFCIAIVLAMSVSSYHPAQSPSASSDENYCLRIEGNDTCCLKRV